MPTVAVHCRSSQSGRHLWRGRAAGGNTTRPSPCRLGCHVACHAAQEGRRGLAAIRPTGGCLPPRGTVAEPSTATDRPPGRWSGAGLTSVWEPRKAGPTAKGGALGEPKGPEGKKLWPFGPVTVYCRQVPIAVAVIVTVTDLCAVTVAVAASSPSPSPTPRREFTGLAAGSTAPPYRNRIAAPQRRYVRISSPSLFCSLIASRLSGLPLYSHRLRRGRHRHRKISRAPLPFAAAVAPPPLLLTLTVSSRRFLDEW